MHVQVKFMEIIKIKKKMKIHLNNSSPYGLSKLIGFEIIKSYREMFKIPVCSVIF